MVLALFDQMMQRIKSNDKAHVTFCVSGIIGCLVVYGILQVGTWMTRFVAMVVSNRHLSNRCLIVGTYYARAFWWRTVQVLSPVGAL